MLDFDITIFIQFVNFVVTIIVLNYLLIKPVRGQISARNALFAKYTSEINLFTENAKQKLQTYEGALHEARASASQLRETVKDAAHTDEQAILSRAQEKAQAFLTSAKKDLEQEATQAREKLLAQVGVFADQAVKKILN